MAELKHILDGYKVLDFTQVLAGPTVTRLMAEMGAEILKVELAPNGELSRGLPYLRNGRSAYFIQQNRGKKSLCIDARTAKAWRSSNSSSNRSMCWSRTLRPA